MLNSEENPISPKTEKNEIKLEENVLNSDIKSEAKVKMEMEESQEFSENTDSQKQKS